MGARLLVQGWLVRATALVLWAFVLWGALLLLLTLLDASGEGLGPALTRLLPSPGASIWAWLNALSAALALAVGIVAAGLLASNLRERGKPRP
jgi:hypothetical protein